MEKRSLWRKDTTELLANKKEREDVPKSKKRLYQGTSHKRRKVEPNPRQTEAADFVKSRVGNVSWVHLRLRPRPYTRSSECVSIVE